MSMLSRLSPRERLLLQVAAPILACLALWQLVWLPLAAARADRTAEIAAYRMVAAAASQADLQPATPASDRAPLATRVTDSAAAAGLVLRRIEPDGAGVLVTLDDADFADLVLWLADLEMGEGVRVVTADIDRRPLPGSVSARLSLEAM